MCLYTFLQAKAVPAAEALTAWQTRLLSRFLLSVSESHLAMVQKLVAEAEKCKENGNALYKEKDYDAAAVGPCVCGLQVDPLNANGVRGCDLQDRYADGLTLAPDGNKVRAVLFANRAACHLEMQRFELAVKDCSSAIDIEGEYLKAWHRRSKAYEGLDDMDRALRDIQKVRLPLQLT